MRENFIKNNLFLVVVLFGIAYLVTLFSTAWGIGILIAITIALYYFSGKNSEESVLNKDIKKLFKRVKSEANNVDINQIKTDAKNGIKNYIPEKGDRNTTKNSPEIQNMSKSKKRNLGITLGLLISSVLSFMGVFVPNFLQSVSMSLFDLLNQAINGMSTYEGITSSLGMQNNNMTGQLELILAVLIVVPIVVALFSISKSKILYVLSFVLSALEVIMVVMIYSQLPEITTRILSEFISLGMSGYMLVIGALGMTVISFIGIFVQGKNNNK